MEKFLKQFILIIHKNKLNRRYYHNIPFMDFYKKTTGNSLNVDTLTVLKKKHPNIEKLSYEQIQSSLYMLKKFNITELEACLEPHVFVMNPLTVDNYGEILKECGFIKIIPKFIIRYHTLVKSRTIEKLKNYNLIARDNNIEEILLKCFNTWPTSHSISTKCSESECSLLDVRVKILGLYLNWRLNVTDEEFVKYCRQYLPLKHKPMSDIQRAVDFAEHELNIEQSVIRRNGFIISTDPVHSKLIVENVASLAGLDIKQVIRMEPAILKNNYNAILQIRNILEEYRIPIESQRKCLKVYCLTPNTVKKRLIELNEIKEFNILASNPRVLSMVVHKRKMISRLNKIRIESKQCYSLNRLVSSSKVFNTYINNFGNKACGRDLATLICSSLNISSTLINKKDFKKNNKTASEFITNQLKKHKYWLYVALNVVDENVKILKEYFTDAVILRNCQLLMYPISEIQYYLHVMLQLRSKSESPDSKLPLDSSYNNLNCSCLTDEQLLSLILYELEKKHHFSGDGIWSKGDQQKVAGKSVS